MSAIVESEGMFGQLIGVMVIVVGIIIAILVVSALDSTIETPQSSLNLNPNSDTVLASGYDALDGADASGLSTALGFRTVLIFEHDATIRQEDSITAVTVKTGADIADPDFNEVRFQIWHKDGATYDLVDETSNLITEYKAIGASSTGTITLTGDDILTGGIEGDRMAIQFGSAQAGLKVIANTAADSTVGMYFTDSDPADTNFDWEAQTTATNFLRLQYSSQAPSIVFIGDSITAGHNVHDSFIESSGTDRGPANTAPHKIADSLGVKMQNMGHGTPDNQASDGLARFTEDVVDLKPKAVVIGYGTSEVNQSVAQATFIANMQSMITEAKNAGITPIIYEIYPRDYDTIGVVDAKDTNRLSFNTALNTLANDNDITIISTDDAIGDGGSPMALAPAFNDDDTHPNAAGYTEIANVATVAIQNAGMENAITDARQDLLDNSAVFFSLAAVLVLLLLIPLIRVVLPR